MTKWDMEEVLEQSLSQIAAGKARLESSLVAYPALADELKPLLLAAETLWAIPKPVPSPEASARIEAQVLAAAAASRGLRPARQRRRSAALPRWSWALSALAAVFVCVILTMTTLVTASAQALPGSGLYPVKLATEDAWLQLAPARQEPRLHLRLAQRRLAEVVELAERGRFEPSVVEAMVAQLESALTEAEELPADQALLLLAEAQAQIEDEQQALSLLEVSLPAGAKPDLARALGTMVTLIERIGEMRRVIAPNEPLSPSPASALTATSTIEASGTVTPTTTLLSTGTPSPSPTLMLTIVPTATPTSSPPPTLPKMPTEPPAVQSTPIPPTDTPPPPPTDTPPPPPTDTPPPPPTDTPPPAPTKHVPPGQTKTPEPPGQTKTPRP